MWTERATKISIPEHGRPNCKFWKELWWEASKASGLNQWASKNVQIRRIRNKNLIREDRRSYEG